MLYKISPTCFCSISNGIIRECKFSCDGSFNLGLPVCIFYSAAENLLAFLPLFLYKKLHTCNISIAKRSNFLVHYTHIIFQARQELLDISMYTTFSHTFLIPNFRCSIVQFRGVVFNENNTVANICLPRRQGQIFVVIFHVFFLKTHDRCGFIWKFRGKNVLKWLQRPSDVWLHLQHTLLDWSIFFHESKYYTGAFAKVQLFRQNIFFYHILNFPIVVARKKNDSKHNFFRCTRILTASEIRIPQRSMQNPETVARNREKKVVSFVR